MTPTPEGFINTSDMWQPEEPAVEVIEETKEETDDLPELS